MGADNCESFLFEKSGPVTTITFNRPERLNCLNRDVMLEMDTLLRRVRDERDTRVMILTGAGKAFSAGAEMPRSKSLDDTDKRRAFGDRNKGVPRMIGRVFDLITRLDCMTIAAVNG